MDGLGRGIGILFTLLNIMLFAGLPICFGLGILVGWIIWR